MPKSDVVVMCILFEGFCSEFCFPSRAIERSGLIGRQTNLNISILANHFPVMPSSGNLKNLLNTVH